MNLQECYLCSFLMNLNAFLPASSWLLESLTVSSDPVTADSTFFNPPPSLNSQLSLFPLSNSTLTDKAATGRPKIQETKEPTLSFMTLLRWALTHTTSAFMQRPYDQLNLPWTWHHDSFPGRQGHDNQCQGLERKIEKSTASPRLVLFFPSFFSQGLLFPLPLPPTRDSRLNLNF